MSSLLQRSIVHLDADAFFASVEQASDARLRGKPIAVGGEKRGVIASASYEARRMGIYTPMPTALARRLCPKLILLPGDFTKYELFSRLMFSYAYDFTPDVEVGSIDEGYLDLTGTRKPAVAIAQTLREAIRQSLKLPISEGIGSNKLISQIASKLHKPCAFEFVPQGEEANFLEPLLNKWLPGVGPKTSQQLTAAGLAKIGQIARTPPDLLGLLVGSAALQLRNFARGLDERPVVSLRAEAKSYGEQETFASDTTDEEFLQATLRRMADNLMAKVRGENKSVRTVTVKIRYNDMDEAQAGESLSEPTDLESDIYSTISGLLRKAWQRRVSLRLVGLTLSQVYAGSFASALTLEAADNQHAARERLALTLDALRQKYGKGSVFRGHDFTLRKKKNAGVEPSAGGSPGNALCMREVAVPYGVMAARRQMLANSIARLPDKRPPALCLSPRRKPFKTKAIPINVHSCYSFLDSTLSIPAIIDLAVRHELPAIALTDRSNLHGAVEFAQAAAKAGIKPIIGTELEWHGNRLCLYVQNAAGYGRLCRILGKAQAGPNLSPDKAASSFFDAELLFGDTEGLVAAGTSGELSRFFPGRFYRMAASTQGIENLPSTGPAIASLPVHYATAEDRWKYDIVQSIRTLTLLRQAHPCKTLDADWHFRTPGEIQTLFQGRPEFIEHTQEIVESCSFQFNLGTPQFPAYKPLDGSAPAAFLRQLAFEGLLRRYPRNHNDLRPQLQEELGIITEVGYEEYFLVMWDILQECRRRGISWITRGSAADSLVCYCLGISGVCPIRFDLYFRRFLNKERMALNKLPDIDVDFPHDRKDDVIELIFEKYGPEHTAVVGGFSTFQARSAFAEIAKVLGVSEFQVRRITERLPFYSRASDLAAAVSESLECRDLPLDQEPYASALHMAQFLDGFPRYAKMHPCGLVLSRQPMHELTACFTSAKGYPTTHFDMDSVEAIGLIKMDILAQGGLAVMRDVQKSLAESPRSNEGRPSADRLDLLEPWNNPEVWELIASGNARAVHHIESPAMISLCRMCNVRDIDTLIAIVSVIRPGAANESKKMEFARRYQGLSPVRYPHPSLESCLRSTYGLVVYEEHILQICEQFAGLPPGRADLLRRALAKDKTDFIEEIRLQFIEWARKLGRQEPEITEVWDLVTGFRGYAFCKAHSTAYGVEAYESAWLKRYYPAEFMAAVLTNGKGFYSPLVYTLECRRLGIDLLPPDVNEPGPEFKVVEGKIRVPLLQVKGVTQHTRDIILRERARTRFVSLVDFFLRVHPSSDEMESFIRVGAFDSFGETRTTQYWETKALYHDPAARQNGRRTVVPAAEQLWLLPPANLDRLPAVPRVEPDRQQKLRWEEELLGFTASGHPLELYPDIAWDSYCPIDRLANFVGQEVVACGLTVEQRIFHQVTGEPMKFITIADRTGIIETELFAKTYKSYGLNTVRYRVLEVTAKVEPFENGRGYTLRVLRAGKPRGKVNHRGTETQSERPQPRENSHRGERESVRA